MAEASHQQVLASVKGFLISGAYSDLTITCGSDTYKVHKVIVCKRADFFARALRFGGQESQNGNIDLPDDEPEIVKLLVHYLYEGEYKPLLPSSGSLGDLPITPVKPPRPVHDASGHHYHYTFPHTCQGQNNYCNYPFVCPHHKCKGPGYGSCSYMCKEFDCKECNPTPLLQLNGTSGQLLIHAKMYEIADKYDVDGLKDLVKEKFSRACQHFWDKPKFAMAANHAFCTTPEHDKGIRDIVSATISKHMELVEKPEVKVLMTQFNGLALGILEEKIKEHGWGRKK